MAYRKKTNKAAGTFNKARVKAGRDILLFVIGIAGIINEAFFSHLDRPDILVLFMAMVGLPAFLRSDERIRGRDTTDAVEENPTPPHPIKKIVHHEPTHPPRPRPRPRPAPRVSHTPSTGEGEYDDLDQG